MLFVLVIGSCIYYNKIICNVLYIPLCQKLQQSCRWLGTHPKQWLCHPEADPQLPTVAHTPWMSARCAPCQQYGLWYAASASEEARGASSDRVGCIETCFSMISFVPVWWCNPLWIGEEKMFLIFMLFFFLLFFFLSFFSLSHFVTILWWGAWLCILSFILWWSNR